MKQNISIVVIVIFFMFFTGASRAESRSVKALDYWPAWRGSLVNGTAPHADPPVEWGPSKNIKWKLDIPGRATPRRLFGRIGFSSSRRLRASAR